MFLMMVFLSLSPFLSLQNHLKKKTNITWSEEGFYKNSDKRIGLFPFCLQMVCVGI